MSYWEMGGYAIYVWPSYAATFLVLALNVLAVIIRAKKGKF